MNRKAEKFFDAITLLREDLVEEAQSYVFRRKRSAWKTFGSLAACIALVMSLGMLATLPRGCGATKDSSSGSMNNSAAPPASSEPAAPPPDANVDLPYNDGSPSAAPSDPSGEVPPTEAEQLFFSAQVLEVLEDALLVEPFDDLPVEAEQVRVSTVGLENPPAFYPGGVVMIRCGGIVWEDGEAVAEDVVMLDLVEPDGP